MESFQLFYDREPTSACGIPSVHSLPKHRPLCPLADTRLLTRGGRVCHVQLITAFDRPDVAICKPSPGFMQASWSNPGVLWCEPVRLPAVPAPHSVIKLSKNVAGKPLHIMYQPDQKYVKVGGGDSNFCYKRSRSLS